MVSVLVVGGASDSRASTRILADTTGTFEICDVVPGVQPKEGYFRRGRSRGVAESSAEFALRAAEAGEVLRALHGSSRSSVRLAGSLCSP